MVVGNGMAGIQAIEKYEGRKKEIWGILNQLEADNLVSVLMGYLHNCRGISRMIDKQNVSIAV